ncbi:hypothetical protein CesoFtcFv8_004346 [Champsocephalus esox]|uniref:Uncharacterized protein n=1 Tax=Champsocephalus esox TaxID=159716 RepID=A0AAN8CYN1_9TELE|nr:hypothetical protein CesoFtcFv8_004346 [Champsocephalus esox]
MLHFRPRLLKRLSQWELGGQGSAAHWLPRRPRASSRRSSRSLSLHILQSMDYTVSLQVEHQLSVFPTHLYQEYSVEVQVRAPLPLLFLSSSPLPHSRTLWRCVSAAARAAC